MSVLTYLKGVASEAVLSADEKSSIRKSIFVIEERLENYFPGMLLRHFVFGSFTRDTILPRRMDDHSDIDYMIVFNDDGFAAQTYLKWLKEFSETKYSTSFNRQSFPAVVLELNHIKFDLVPATYSSFFGYQIPDKGGNWIYTDPLKFSDDLERLNVEHGRLIKPAIRLVKYWNTINGYPYVSYELEQKIANMNFSGCRNEKECLFIIFENLKWDFSSIFKSQSFQQKLERACRIAKEAKDLEANGFVALAEKEIIKLVPI